METMNRNNTLKDINATAKRSLEIMQAVEEFPRMEIGAAYMKWKEARGETAVMLNTTQQASITKNMQVVVDELRSRPCTNVGCNGIQRLESVCSSCIEGQAGYKSKWTCMKCLHRDLSKESLNEWILKLSSF